jgi:tripartite-type tricarboxylate transporter receptor subunit TctC
MIATAAAAQSYPGRNVTFVVAFAPGGVADTVARLVAQKLSEKFGQTFVVENKGGAGGNLAAKIVAAAPADGYSILVTTTAAAINDTISKNKGYATSDLRTIAIAASTPEIMVVHASHPAKTLKEFVAGARGKNFTFGTAGIGTGSYIAAEYFFRAIAKLDSVHVPFSGGAPALNAVLGNQVDLLALSLPPAVAQINQGAIRGLGVAHPTRVPSIPNVPTYAESGFPDFYAASWVGFFAPAKTSDAVVTSLNTEINRILRDPDIERRLSDLGFDAIHKDLPQAEAYFNSEVQHWGDMARGVGVSIN